MQLATLAREDSFILAVDGVEMRMKDEDRSTDCWRENVLNLQKFSDSRI